MCHSLLPQPQPALPLFSGPSGGREVCVYSDAASGATQGSCRGCPSSHVSHSRRMFLTLSNGRALPGLGLSDWNATEKESPGVIQMLTSQSPCWFLKFLLNSPMTKQPDASTNTMALVGADKCISPGDRDANLNILLSHVYSAALSPTLHQIRNRQQPALCWMTLMSRKNSAHFLKKMYSHSLHGPACYILFLRKPNPWGGGGAKA